MVYPFGVDVFSRKKHKKEPQKAARGAVVLQCWRGVNPLTKRVAHKAGWRRLFFQCGRKVHHLTELDTRPRGARLFFYVAMFQQKNSGHKIGALFYQQKTR